MPSAPWTTARNPDQWGIKGEDEVPPLNFKRGKKKMTAKMARIYIPGVGDAEIAYEGGTPYKADSPDPVTGGFPYPIGAILTLGNRKFAYCSASGTQIPDVGSQIGGVQAVANCAVQANYAAGVTTITITEAATDGWAHNGLIAKDELKGGWIVVFPAGGNKKFTRQIVHNSACTISQSNTMTVELDSPTPVAITTGASAECMHSEYYKVKTASSPVASTVCIPTVAATDGQGFWGLIEGVDWVAPSAGVGNSAHDKEIVFIYNGSIAEHDYSAAYDTKQQHAGFVLANAYGGTQGAPFCKFRI
jgi:hypothetical protein